MTRVLVIYDVPGWAYHNRALALRKFAPDDVAIEIASMAEFSNLRRQSADGIFHYMQCYDVVFMLDYASVEPFAAGLRRAGCRHPIVTSFNRDSQERRHLWDPVCNASDLVIVNNMDRWLAGGRRQNTVCVANGVDMAFYRPIVPITERPARALWTGSSGPAKKKRYRELLEPLAAQIDADFRPISSASDGRIQTPEQMVAWYNSGSFILCASASEATPNTTLEGIACGCIPVTTYVGNVREFGTDRQNCVICEPTVESFRDGIAFATEHREQLAAAVRQNLIDGCWDWSLRSRYFYEIFRRLHHNGSGSIRPFTYMEVAPDAI